MKILRYTPEVQKQLGSKTKPEPWLHVAIDMPKERGDCLFVIYVWDTRQVVEEGNKMIWVAKNEHIIGTPAKDNHQVLQGLKKYKEQFKLDEPKQDNSLMRELNTIIANCNAVSRHGFNLATAERDYNAFKRKLTALKRRKPSGNAKQDKLLEEAKRDLEDTIAYFLNQKHQWK